MRKCANANTCPCASRSNRTSGSLQPRALGCTRHSPPKTVRFQMFQTAGSSYVWDPLNIEFCHGCGLIFLRGNEVIKGVLPGECMVGSPPARESHTQVLERGLISRVNAKKY